jgi:hypothetical protein
MPAGGTSEQELGDYQMAWIDSSVPTEWGDQALLKNRELKQLFPDVEECGRLTLKWLVESLGSRNERIEVQFGTYISAGEGKRVKQMAQTEYAARTMKPAARRRQRS